MGERALGRADAPVVVMEFFSLTCPHCAAFHRETFPQVKTKLIDTGKLRMTFRDFPLDQVALTAAMVARTLAAGAVRAVLRRPVRHAGPLGLRARRELDRGAGEDGGAGGDVAGGLRRRDQGPGIARPRSWRGRRKATKSITSNSTPTFIFNGPAQKNHRESGGRSYDDFAKLVAAAAG